MTRIFATLVASGLVFGSFGCNQSPEGGTPHSDKSFTFTGPSMSTTIKQGGGPTAIDLKVKPEKQFTETVTFSASKVDGLNIEFNPKEVKPADPKEVKMIVTADKDAPVGDKRVTVTAKPATGTATTIDVSIKVEAAGK